MPEPRPYYSERGLSAAYYDLITDRDRTLDGDISFYAELTPAKGSVLELGAGAGRVALALADRGFTVLGVDLAPAMLAQARDKLAAVATAVAGRVGFRLGDMTSLSLGRTFDTVICPYFGLAHLPAGAAWANTLGVIARHLGPGGRAAIHLPLAEAMAGLPPLDPKLPVVQIRLPGGGALQMFVSERGFREKIGRFDQVLDYVVTDPAGALVRRSQERQTFYAGDPAPFAAKAGLIPGPPPFRLGDAGEIHVFSKPER